MDKIHDRSNNVENSEFMTRRSYILSRLLIAVIGLLLGSGVAHAVGYTPTTQHKNLTGLWYTEGRDGGVELYPCGEEICGRLYWLNERGEQGAARDEKNPDPKKRDRSLCRMEFMGGFHAEGEGHYADGWIYSPEHGEVFSAEMTLLDEDTLDLHGYVLTPILGESQTWKRADAMPSCVDH